MKPVEGLDRRLEVTIVEGTVHIQGEDTKDGLEAEGIFAHIERITGEVFKKYYPAGSSGEGDAMIVGSMRFVVRAKSDRRATDRRAGGYCDRRKR